MNQDKILIIRASGTLRISQQEKKSIHKQHKT